MPDPVFLAIAAAVSGTIAGLIVLCAGFFRRAPRTTAARVAWILSVAIGFAVGCAILQVAPQWPPLEDRDRLLALILPAVVLVELLAAFGVHSRLAGTLRLVIALFAARVLLHGTVYLQDSDLAGKLAWPPMVRYATLAAVALALIVVWGALDWCCQHRSTPVLLASLGLTCCGAGLAIMLSGYASGGQLGLILGGALLGCAVGSRLLTDSAPAVGAIGFGIVGLFSLLLMGKYFGELTSAHAGWLLATPLVNLLPLERCWPRWPRWAVGALVLVLTLIPVGAVVAQAGKRFQENSQPATAPGDSSANDYLNYGS